jgi:hypothetical protein
MVDGPYLHYSCLGNNAENARLTRAWAMRYPLPFF